MNTGFSDHAPESVLEDYALGKLCEQDCAALEEHLLVCLDCQARLEEADEFIGALRAAASSLPFPAVERSGLDSPAPVRSGVPRLKYSPA